MDPLGRWGSSTTVLRQPLWRRVHFLVARCQNSSFPDMPPRSLEEPTSRSLKGLGFIGDFMVYKLLGVHPVRRFL